MSARGGYTPAVAISPGWRYKKFLPPPGENCLPPPEVPRGGDIPPVHRFPTPAKSFCPPPLVCCGPAQTTVPEIFTERRPPKDFSRGGTPGEKFFLPAPGFQTPPFRKGPLFPNTLCHAAPLNSPLPPGREIGAGCPPPAAAPLPLPRRKKGENPPGVLKPPVGTEKARENFPRPPPAKGPNTPPPFWATKKGAHPAPSLG